MSDEKKAGGYILVEDEGWVLEGEEYDKPAPPEVEEEVDLETLTKAELVEMAEQAGVDASGNKADLIERLAD